MNGGKSEGTLDLEQPSVLVTEELSPSDVLRLDPQQVLGVVTNVGGATSHTAILTRTLGVPSVVGLKDITRQINPGELIVVNGNSGKVILRPTRPQVTKYEKKEKQYRSFVKSLRDIQELPAETRDGRRIKLEANIELPEEGKRVIDAGGDGVGLFRTEYLFLAGGGVPTEEEQTAEYKRIAEILHPRPITIRTFDVGGDKAFPGAGIPPEHNPFLGWRAIRVGLDRPEMLLPQLRSILRASAGGNVRMMFPMISDLGEWNRALELLEQARKDLTEEGVAFDETMPVGAMVEVPSVALMAAKFAETADFFSIGTNDLVQFTLAVDRGNEQVAALHQPFHPAVIQLIRRTVRAAHKADIPVAICGEFAASPLATLLLIGLGLDELSVSPGMIPEVKKLIRSCSLEEAQDLASRVEKMDAADQVRASLHRYMRRNYADMPIWFGDR
ncbi:phosphoenolpyruvate--protein phosphotransferase [bacterium]|nr:phosphoenolpyruvate--protein phosphotransferase [bacterium]